MKIGDGAKIGGSKKVSTDQVGIQDHLTVTVRRHCELAEVGECQAELVDDLRFARLKTLHDGDRVELRTRQGEEKHTISLYINWDGDVRLSSRETGKILNINELRTFCHGCGATVYSWREEDGHVRVAEDDLQEGGA
jgi:hypothetical protein